MERSPAANLSDILEAIAVIEAEIACASLDDFEADRRKRWVVERGLEIISEASRRLSVEVKARHSELAWPKIAAIGNVLCHEYQHVAPDIIWHLARNDLEALRDVCALELRGLGA